MRMFASMSIVTGPAPEMAEIARIASESIEGWLRQYEGYRGLIVLTDEQSERARIITFWDSAEAERKARVSRGAMRDRTVATVGMVVEGMELYEVPVFELLPPD
jgi:heme-degrading monooxygenase HmoA